VILLIRHFHINQIRFIRIRHCDRQLAQILVGQVIVYVFTTIFYPTNIIYNLLTSHLNNKSSRRIVIQTSVTFIISSFNIYVECVFFLSCVHTRSFIVSTRPQTIFSEHMDSKNS